MLLPPRRNLDVASTSAWWLEQEKGGLFIQWIFTRNYINSLANHAEFVFNLLVLVSFTVSCHRENVISRVLPDIDDNLVV